MVSRNRIIPTASFIFSCFLLGSARDAIFPATLIFDSHCIKKIGVRCLPVLLEGSRLNVPCVLIPRDFAFHIFLLFVLSSIPVNYRFLAWLVVQAAGHSRTISNLRFTFRLWSIPLLDIPCFSIMHGNRARHFLSSLQTSFGVNCASQSSILCDRER